MSAPAAAEPRTCPTCGQPAPQPLAVCASPGCGHSIVLHRFGNSETANSGPRGACSEFNGKGRCGCRKFTPAEVSGG